MTDAQPFIDAGHALAELHLGYEGVTPHPFTGLDGEAPTGEEAYEHFRVQKMTFAKVRDAELKKLVAARSTIVSWTLRAGAIAGWCHGGQS